MVTSYPMQNDIDKDRSYFFIDLISMSTFAFSHVQCIIRLFYEVNSVGEDCVFPFDIFGVTYVDCNGGCLSDQDGDGTCDEDEVVGCTYEEACNYMATATQEDGSCVFAEQLRNCDGSCLLDLNEDGVCDDLSDFGCTYPEAYNYDELATVDDGTCVFPQGVCQADLNSDGAVTVADLLAFLVFFTETCD